MKIIRRTLLIPLFLVLLFCAWEKSSEDNKALSTTKEFVYKGDNISKYNGQSVLIIDKEYVEAKDTEKFYEFQDKLLNVKVIRYTDKVKSVHHYRYKSIYDACKNTTKVIYGANIVEDWIDYNSDVNYDGHGGSTIAIDHLQYLESMEISAKNKNFSVQDGILYNGNKEEIIYWFGQEAGKTLILPVNLKVLYSQSICDKVDQVETLIINKNLEDFSEHEDNDEDSAFGEGLDVLASFPKLKTVKVASGNSIYHVENGCLYESNDFIGYIPQSGVTEITIPKGTIYYEDGWLSNYRGKITLTLPASLKHYDHYTYSLAKEYIVDDKNPYYFTYQGCLYKKNENSSLVGMVVNSSEQLANKCIELYPGCTDMSYNEDEYISLIVPNMLDHGPDMSYHVSLIDPDIAYGSSLVGPEMTYKESQGRCIPDEFWNSNCKISIEGETKNYQIKDDAIYSNDGKMLYRVRNTGQKSYRLSSRVTIIYPKAFLEWENISSRCNVMLSRKLTSVDQLEELGYFIDQVNLRIEEGNPAFVLSDDLLTSKDGKTIYLCLNGRNKITLTNKIKKLHGMLNSQCGLNKLTIVIEKDVKNLSALNYFEDYFESLSYQVENGNPYYSVYRNSLFDKSKQVLYKLGYKRNDDGIYDCYLPASFRSFDKNTFRDKRYNVLCLHLAEDMKNPPLQQFAKIRKNHINLIADKNSKFLYNDGYYLYDKKTGKKLWDNENGEICK